MVGQPSQSVAAYVDRIHKLTHEKDAVAILAHFYTQQGAQAGSWVAVHSTAAQPYCNRADP